MNDAIIKVLFIGDIFGSTAVNTLAQHLPTLIKKWEVDFVIAQGENVSGRKGLVKSDYEKLKKAGINAITLGNHVWAKEEINQFIEYEDLIRPLNVDHSYPGQGSRVFKVKENIFLRISCFLGITFNELTTGWKQTYANNFFDAFDELDQRLNKDLKSNINNKDVKHNSPVTYHLIDFHAETTSEKNVFALYVDGKADALLGTHTHVQTNDGRILNQGLAFITDVGMTGPCNAAIGADYQSVYEKMRFNSKSKFLVSQNPIQFNGVIITFSQKEHKISKNGAMITVLQKKHKINTINFVF